MTTPQSPLDQSRAALARAIEVAGGQEELGQAVGVPQSSVSFWLNESKQGIPANRVLKIEELYGIPRHEQRPDIYPAPQPAQKERA